MSAATATPVATWRLVLPMPPSVNSLFTTGFTREGKPIRVKTEAYKAWIAAAGYGARWERLSEDKENGIRWRCAIVAYGLEDGRDVDNIIKPVLDLICAMTGLRDNWPQRKVSAERPDDEEVAGEPWIAVTVEVLGECERDRERRAARKQVRRGRR